MEKILRWIYGAHLVSSGSRNVKVYGVKRMFPFSSKAQTWNRTIFIRDEYLGHEDYTSIINHEMVHVMQWRVYGLIFPVFYAYEYVKAFISFGKDAAYTLNRFEVEARDRSNPKRKY
jgi:hypothetical protein